MVDKSAFGTDEWSMLVGSPLLAGMAVTLAEPSGLFGVLKEGMASANAMMEAKRDTGAGPLVKAIAMEMESSDGRTKAKETFRAQLTGKSPAELKQQAIALLGKVGDLVDRKAPEEAAAYKAWLRHIAERTAEASSEGGFLGFGGVQVSEAEKASIAEVSKALRI